MSSKVKGRIFPVKAVQEGSSSRILTPQTPSFLCLYVNLYEWYKAFSRISIHIYGICWSYLPSFLLFLTTLNPSSFLFPHPQQSLFYFYIPVSSSSPANYLYTWKKMYGICQWDWHIILTMIFSRSIHFLCHFQKTSFHSHLWEHKIHRVCIPHMILQR